MSIPIAAFLEAAGLGGGLEAGSMYGNHKAIADTTKLASAPLRSTGVDIAVSINCARKDQGVTED